MKTPFNLSPFKALMIFLIISILGVFLIPKLSIRLNPSESLPSINVQYNWQNASPYAIEREITSVLEGGFSVIKGISSLESKSSKGGGRITLKLDKYADINTLRFEIASVIRQLYKNLPEKSSYPSISLNRPDDDSNNRAFLSYSINAPLSPYEIQEFAESQLEPIIGAIPGIDKTQIYGANKLEYVLKYSQKDLKQLEISRNDIVASIRNIFSKESLGAVYSTGQTHTLPCKVNKATKLTNFHKC